jgi:predicted nucleic acid-binding protein
VKAERLLLGRDELGADRLAGGFLFDTNVWVYLQGPLQDYMSAPARAYSAFLGRVIAAGGSLHLPQLVLAEFGNVALNILAKANGWQPGSAKIHQHADYKKWVVDVCDSIHAVASDCARLDDGFSDLDLADLTAKIERTKLDLNDHLISEICRRKGLILVTHDRDFAQVDLPIVTANRRLG